MALADGKIVASTSDMLDATYNLLSHLIDDDTEIVTMIYGEDATEEQVNAVDSVH